LNYQATLHCHHAVWKLKKEGKKQTEQNFTVYQAKTTSMCIVNRSAWMHHIVSRLVNFNEAAAL